MRGQLRAHRIGWSGAPLATLWLLLAPSAVLSADLTLAPRFAADEELRYRMHLTLVTDSSLNPLGRALQSDQTLRLAIDMTWRVEVLEALAEGGARLRVIVEDLSLVTSGRPVPAPVEDFIGKAATYRLGADGHVYDLVAPETWLREGRPPAWLQAWLEQASGSAADVPDHPVSPGETWHQERSFDVQGLPTQSLVSESVYRRDEEANGRPCASILTRFELSGADTHFPEELTGSAEIVRQVEGGGTRLSCYDHRSGRLLQSTQKSHEHIRIQIMNHPRRANDDPAAVLESTTTIESQLSLVE